MYGLFINLGIQVLSRVSSRYKFFGWWMIIAFLWASAIAWQLPPPHRGSHEFEDVVTEISPEQYCAKAPLEKRDECLRVAKSVDRILGPLRLLRLKGAAHYTSMEKLELMLGPPLGLLVVGFAVALIAKRVRGSPSVTALTISAISLMIVSFLVAASLLTHFLFCA